MPLVVTRRAALLGLSAAFTVGGTSLALASAVTEKRFVVILLRGALDGLSAVQPYGDPNFAAVRGPLALPQPGRPGGTLDLGGMYGLHPSLAQFHTLYASGEALIIHAVAGHNRSRSHFEAQDWLEIGADTRLNSGWLNRAVAAMPAPDGQELALSLGLSAPLILRGPTTVQAYAPEHFGKPSDDLYQRLITLSAHDKLIGPAMAEGIKRRGYDAAVLAGQIADPKHDRTFEMLASAAGHLLAQPDGPRIAALELGGWDTHEGQAKRLAGALAQLDAGIAALKAGLGPQWRQTVVLAVTEFGRTAHMNGTNGTDHGTGGVAFLAGGAVAGGHVRTTWPGLRDDQLFEHRDLAPTTDVRSLIKAVLADHLHVPAARFAAILPGSQGVSPIHGLVRS